MNYTKRSQNTQALSVSLGKIYSEDQLMHILLDISHKGGKYTSQIASQQAELRIEEEITDQKHLSITYLQTDYLSYVRNNGCSTFQDFTYNLVIRYVLKIIYLS